jgi:hypothetical protein
MGEGKRKALYVGRDTRHAESACLGCGKVIDAATGIGHKRRPKPGDITICLSCGHLQAYDWGMRLRALTDKEMFDVAGDEQILAIQEVAGMFRSKRAS